MNRAARNEKNAAPRRTARPVHALLVLFGALLISLPLHSQGNAGRILGAVVDQSGGTIAGATVTIEDVQRGITRTLTTDGAGEYNAPNLLPGTYKVRATDTGFKTAEQSNILLQVGKEVRVDLTLQPGEQIQTITVNEAPPQIETSNATLGGTLSNETINDLPLNGRNFENLLSLRPGVTNFVGGGAWTQSTNGVRPEDNVFVLDGLNDDEAYAGLSIVNQATLAGDATTILPIDAIQEFNTEENPKAEYGWKPGATVVVGLKSGTNNLHGTAYAFGRSDVFDARDFFNFAPNPKAPVELEQFGASAGGPIKKDKLFWFAAFEEQRYSVGSTFSTSAPATASLASIDVTHAGCSVLTTGNCKSSLVDACNDLGRANVSALSALLAGLPAGSCIPRPTNTAPGPSESLFPSTGASTSYPLNTISNNLTANGLGKIDYHINDHHTVGGMFFFGQDNGNYNDAANEVLPIWDTVIHVRSVVGTGNWVWVPNSNRVNELRVGYSHFFDSSLSADETINPENYGINTGVTNPLYYGFPVVQIQPFPLSQFRLGAMWPKILGPESVLQAVDHYSILRGKHSFKFGGEFISNRFTGTITTDAKGYIKFASLEDFLTGTPASSGSKILTGDPKRELHNFQYAAFLQDDWRVTSKLTLNLGLRYEVDTILHEAQNRIANFDPAVGLVQVGHGINSAYNGDYNNFAPRFGLAWDIHGNAKNVVRAGASIIYQQMPFAVFVAPGNGNGLFTIPTGASIVTCPASCMNAATGGLPVTTAGNGTIAVTAVSIPGGPGSTLASNWANNGPNTPLFPTAAVTCGDGLTPPATSANGFNPVADPAPCNVAAIDRNLRNPYVTTWTLGIEHAFTNNLSLEIAYVGNHGSKLIGIQDINQPAVGSGFPGAGSTSGTALGEVAWCNSNNIVTTANPLYLCDPGDVSPALEQAGRPQNGKFPYLGFINRISNLDLSNYEGLQVSFTQRPVHGFSFEAGYTYSHSLDDVSSTYQALIPSDSTNPNLQYGNTDFDIRHRFTLSASYRIPGRPGFAQMLEGWQINSILTIESGAPWGPMDMSNDFSGTGDVNNNPTYGQRWNFVGNTNDFKAGRGVPLSCWSGSGPSAIGGCTIGTEPMACLNAAAAAGTGAVNTLTNVGCYIVGNSVLIPPALGTFGTVGRNLFRDLGYRGWDMSLSKNNVFLKERLTTQFRVEVFNILNHPTFGNPWGPYMYGTNDPSTGVSGNFGCACVTADTAASNPVLGSGGSRSIQLGLKLIF